MGKQYDEFKKRTIEATDVISKAHNMRALSDDFVDGFAKAMWEAREIYMRVEDDFASNESDEPTNQSNKDKSL